MYQAVHVAVCLCEEPQAPRQLCMHQLLVRIPQVLDTCGEVQAKIGRKERQMVDFFFSSDTSWSMLDFWRRNSGGSGQTERNNSLPSPAISPEERESLRVCTRAGTLEAVGTAIQRLRYVALSFGQQLQPIVRCVYRFRWRGLTWSWQEQLWCRSTLSAMDSELYFLQPF